MPFWARVVLPPLLVVAVVVGAVWYWGAGVAADRAYLRAASAALDAGPDLGELAPAVDAASADPALLHPSTRAGAVLLAGAQAAELQAGRLRAIRAPAGRAAAHALLLDAAGDLDAMAGALRQSVAAGDPALLADAAAAAERYAGAVDAFAVVVAP